MNSLKRKRKKNVKPIALPEGHEERVIQAAIKLRDEKIAQPILIGNPADIEKIAGKKNLSVKGIHILNPAQYPDIKKFSQIYYELRKHKGMTLEKAAETIVNPLYFGAMLVREGLAAGAVAGSIHTTGDVLRAAIQIIGMMPNVNVVSSCFLMVLPKGEILTFADCAVIPDPDPEQLASIAISAAMTHRRLVGNEPKIAMLSFSTKGSAEHPMVDKVIQATHLIKKIDPTLVVDGELQFDAAYVAEVGKRKAPDSPVAGKANVFIFPDLDAANIAYKMVQRLAGAEAIGPIIQGLAKPYNDLSRGCSVDDIVNVAAICSILSNS